MPGPRMRVAVKGIYQTNGQGDRPYMPIEWVQQKENCVLADGVVECRRAVRLMLREGADFIKIATSGGHLSAEPHFTLEEVSAMCDEAHRMGMGRRTCIRRRGYPNGCARRCGQYRTWRISYSRNSRLMAERDVPIVPTLAIPRMTLRGEPQYPLTDQERTKWEKSREGANESVRLAKANGVRIALGTDFGGQPFFPPDALAVELEFLTDAGLSPHQAIVAATQTAADVIGVSEQVGTLTAGKKADLIGVNGNPLTDIKLIAKCWSGGQEWGLYSYQRTWLARFNSLTDVASVGAIFFTVFEFLPI